jgi:hypothetical protein
MTLRKEKEQDKQTIKLLQEQMVCFILLFIEFNFFWFFSINIPVKQTVDNRVFHYHFYDLFLSFFPY